MNKILCAIILCFSSLYSNSNDDSRYVYYQLLIAEGEMSIAQQCIAVAAQNCRDKEIVSELKQKALFHIEAVMEILKEEGQWQKQN